LLFAVAAPARADNADLDDPCVTVFPKPMFDRSQVSKHRFRRGPNHSAEESGLLGETPIHAETTGCADSITIELAVRLPRAMASVREMAAALLAFFDGHRDAMKKTPLGQPAPLAALRDLAAGVARYHAGDRYCVTTPKAVIAAGAGGACGLAAVLSARAKGAGTMELRFTWIDEL
jgi:hypothetical protein